MVTKVTLNSLLKQLNITLCQVMSKTTMCGLTLKIKICSHFLIIYDACNHVTFILDQVWNIIKGN
jgi:hypothetical protein